MRHLLLESVGPYCAYCESPVGTDFPVSVRVSVNPFPKAMIQANGQQFEFQQGVSARRFREAWVNQHVACAACVAAKGDEPGSKAGFLRLAAIDPAKFTALVPRARNARDFTNDDQDDLFMAALNTWVWPDTTSDDVGILLLAGDRTFKLFDYEWSSASQSQLGARGLVRSDRLPANAAWVNQPRQGAWVIPNDSYINTLPERVDMRARVQATILGFDLNRWDPTSLDRRAENRSAVYPAVGRAYESLKAVVVATPKPVGVAPDVELDHASVAALSGAIRETIRATGFWSIWAHLFVKPITSNADPVWARYTLSARRRLLYALLVQYEEDHRRLPGQFAIRASKDVPIPPDELEDEIEFQMVLAGTDVERLDF
jgi:hypothetical protein